MAKTRIIFFGTPEFAVPALETLYKADYDIIAVITQPDKPVGRKQVLSPSPVKEAALRHNIQVLQPPTLKNDEIFQIFQSLSPDICIVAAYGKIIPKRFLDLPRYGFINIHPSLLPKYRGPSPVQTAILNGEKETGVSIMILDEEVDHGPTLATKRQGTRNKSYEELGKELAETGAKLLAETLPKYISGEIIPQEQDHSQATFTKMFKREDGRIYWNKPAEEIFNQVKALNPEPGTWTIWPTRRNLGEDRQNNIINIPTCGSINYDKNTEPPGTVKKNGNDIVISTGTGYLTLKTIQLEGKKEMDVKEFVNGHPDFLGSVLE